MLPTLERLLGLYLSVTWVTMVVVSSHLWRRANRLAAGALLVAPLAIWGAWAAARVLPTFWRAHIGLGLLAALPALPLIPLAWLLSEAPLPHRDSMLERFLGAMPVALSPGEPTGMVAWGISAVGAAWFAYGFVALRESCAVDAVLGALRATPPDARRAMVCVSSPVGLWPLSIVLTLVAASAVARPAIQSRRQRHA